MTPKSRRSRAKRLGYIQPSRQGRDSPPDDTSPFYPISCLEATCHHKREFGICWSTLTGMGCLSNASRITLGGKPKRSTENQRSGRFIGFAAGIVQVLPVNQSIVRSGVTPVLSTDDLVVLPLFHRTSLCIAKTTRSSATIRSSGKAYAIAWNRVHARPSACATANDASLSLARTASSRRLYST